MKLMDVYEFLLGMARQIESPPSLRTEMALRANAVGAADRQIKDLKAALSAVVEAVEAFDRGHRVDWDDAIAQARRLL